MPNPGVRIEKVSQRKGVNQNEVRIRQQCE